MKTERIVKVTIIWLLVAVSVAILSKQIASIFYNTWLGSVIMGVKPNILWVCLVLTIIWLYYTWKEKYKGFNIICFGLSLFTFIFFWVGNVELTNTAYNPLFFAILFLLALPQLIHTVGFIWKNGTNCFRKLKWRTKVIWKKFTNYLRSKKKEANKPEDRSSEEEQDAILFQGPFNTKDSIFIYDRFNKDNDKLHVGRKQMVDTIVDEVRKLKHDESSFTIGLEGGWGSGKTTLLNKIKTELKGTTDAHGMTVEVVEFSPWAYPDGKSLSVEFLYELRDVLSKHSFRARFVINAYINALADKTTNILQLLAMLFFPRESLQKVKAKLSDLLRFHRIKLVVIIDDLDRLDEAELVEVFKMLRNTGDLPNAVYLVAYDRMHVEAIDTLKQKQEENRRRFGSGYLDKVINVELDINGYNKDVLFGEFLSKATRIMKSGSYYLVDTDNFNGFDSLNQVYHPHLKILRTKRDEIRILNSLSFRLEQLKSNYPNTMLIRFNPQVIILLELIKHGNPRLYKLIKSKAVFNEDSSIGSAYDKELFFFAFKEMLNSQNIISINGMSLSSGSGIYIDYYFVQSQAEANILYEIGQQIYSNDGKQKFDSFSLKDIISRDSSIDNNERIKDHIRFYLVSLLKKDNWNQNQLKGLLRLIVEVVWEPSFYKAIEKSLKIFVVNNVKSSNRTMIITYLFKEIHKKREADDRYNISFCDLSRELIKNITFSSEIEGLIMEFTKLQIKRNEALLEGSRFKDALKESVYFSDDKNPEATLLIDTFKDYLKASNHIVKSFEGQLITEDKDRFYIGGHDFPIGVLFPSKEDLISILRDAKTDEEPLISLASFLEKHIDIIQKKNNVFWIMSEKDICYKELEESKLLRFLYRPEV